MDYGLLEGIVAGLLSFATWLSRWVLMAFLRQTLGSCDYKVTWGEDPESRCTSVLHNLHHILGCSGDLVSLLSNRAHYGLLRWLAGDTPWTHQVN